MKWKNEKNELERLINVEHISHEEIGRKYSVTARSYYRYHKFDENSKIGK